jgi:hypothetical protein
LQEDNKVAIAAHAARMSSVLKSGFCPGVLIEMPISSSVIFR